MGETAVDHKVRSGKKDSQTADASWLAPKANMLGAKPTFAAHRTLESIEQEINVLWAAVIDDISLHDGASDNALALDENLDGSLVHSLARDMALAKWRALRLKLLAQIPRVAPLRAQLATHAQDAQQAERVAAARAKLDDVGKMLTVVEQGKADGGDGGNQPCGGSSHRAISSAICGVPRTSAETLGKVGITRHQNGTDQADPRQDDLSEQGTVTIHVDLLFNSFKIGLDDALDQSMFKDYVPKTTAGVLESLVVNLLLDIVLPGAAKKLANVVLGAAADPSTPGAFRSGLIDSTKREMERAAQGAAAPASQENAEIKGRMARRAFGTKVLLAQEQARANLKGSYLTRDSLGRRRVREHILRQTPAMVVAQAHALVEHHIRSVEPIRGKTVQFETSMPYGKDHLDDGTPVAASTLTLINVEGVAVANIAGRFALVKGDWHTSGPTRQVMAEAGGIYHYEVGDTPEVNPFTQSKDLGLPLQVEFVRWVDRDMKELAVQQHRAVFMTAPFEYAPNQVAKLPGR